MEDCSAYWHCDHGCVTNIKVRDGHLERGGLLFSHKKYCSVKLENCLITRQDRANPVLMLRATTGTAQVSEINWHIFSWFRVAYTYSLDYDHCPCKNWDEDNQMFCEDSDFEEFYPVFNDCASYLNCSKGCIEEVLVGEKFTFSNEKNV